MAELNLKLEVDCLSPAAVRVLIAEDFPRFRQFICSMLAGRSDLRIIEEVSDGVQAVQKAAELKPDLILLDIGASEDEWHGGCTTDSCAGARIQDNFLESGVLR